MEEVMILMGESLWEGIILIDMELVEAVFIFNKFFEVDGNGLVNCISFLDADNFSSVFIKFN